VVVGDPRRTEAVAQKGKRERLMSAGQVKERRICPTCGNVNDCGMEKGETTCWCFAVPHVLPVSETEEGGSCFCRACLSRMIAELEARRCTSEQKATRLGRDAGANDAGDHRRDAE